MTYKYSHYHQKRIGSAYYIQHRILHKGMERIHLIHDDVIKWIHFPCYLPFVCGIHRWPVNSPHKGQWRGALMFSLICAWIGLNSWVKNREAGDLKRHRAHYGVIVMSWTHIPDDTWKTSYMLSAFKQFSIILTVRWYEVTREYGQGS